ncbi:unnamed protein product [Xylocopa violacea]|uniref:Uncharacterized protein n=1 Tax=Xylocopa violacea TaxID=135666 RepID=A0ABP1MYP9_XYLVO
MDGYIFGISKMYRKTSVKERFYPYQPMPRSWMNSERRYSVIINVNFLDVDDEKRRLYDVRDAVKKGVTEIKMWFESLETQLEIRVSSNEPHRNITLFKQLNALISKLKQYENMLNTWHSKFQKLVYSALKDLNNCAERIIQLKNIKRNFNSSIATDGIPSCAVKLAKERKAMSNSMQKQLNMASKAEARLRTVKVSIKTEVDSFFQGVIMVNHARYMNLFEVEQLLNGLPEEYDF